MKKGRLFIISGPSGVGKGTVIDGVLADKDLNLFQCKTVTSRTQRGEKSDKQYIFVTATQFERAVREKDMLEYNFYNGNYYGTSEKLLYELLEAGKNVILEVDVNGALEIKEQMPTAKAIFIYSTIENLEKRLRARGENTEEQVQERLMTARKELGLKDRYDYQVENPEGMPQAAINKAREIITKNIS